MIDAFVGFCLHQRVAIIVLAVLLSGFGIYAWETLSVEAYPDLGDVAAQVTVCSVDLPHLRVPRADNLHAALVDPTSWDNGTCHRGMSKPSVFVPPPHGRPGAAPAAPATTPQSN